MKRIRKLLMQLTGTFSIKLEISLNTPATLATHSTRLKDLIGEDHNDEHRHQSDLAEESLVMVGDLIRALTTLPNAISTSQPTLRTEFPYETLMEVQNGKEL